LKSDELDRANRYYHKRDLRRFITSRGALRIILGKYLKKNPADIEFATTVTKKPFLKEPLNNLYFNISHSENYILIAIADSEIGIDVEKVDSLFDWPDILHTRFSKDEILWVKQSKSPKDSFYLLWTRKEALAKATGKGLQDNLLIFPSLDGTHQLNQFEFANSWEIRSFEIDQHTKGGIAYPPSIIINKFFIMNFEFFE
jgi:4'-phosphopantetheinyl transferase